MEISQVSTLLSMFVMSGMINMRIFSVRQPKKEKAVYVEKLGHSIFM